MKKQDVDYSLYLVTDSTPAILGNNGLCKVVEEALKGGVTCVQYRDKTPNKTAEKIATAKKLHAVTQRYGVPLLINDHIDVAQAVGCEGVHIGQDDTNVADTRKILGPDAIIGVSVGNVTEANKAVIGGADYLGIGTIFATPTKTDTKDIIGTDGLQLILSYLHTSGSKVKTVCIGGINASNVSRVMWQSTAWGKSVDGAAVVSAIISAPDREAAAKELVRLMKTPPPFSRMCVTDAQKARKPDEVKNLAPEIIKAVVSKKPLSHNMTNLVVQNFAANVALSIGASPIMSNYGEEAADLAALGGALVINMGTVTPDSLANYLMALKAYNAAGQPVVFDPVGAGATAVRRQAAKTILNSGYIDVIKGNQSEILSIAPGGSALQQRGVDSGPEQTDAKRLATIVRDFARLRKCVVVMTGKVDYVSAGKTVYTIANGNDYLGIVTGTGCCLGTTISAMIAAYPQDKLAATVAAMLHFEIAAEEAAKWEKVKLVEKDEVVDLTGGRPSNFNPPAGMVRGPGTFVPAFLDELYRIKSNACLGDQSIGMLWNKPGSEQGSAKVDIVEGLEG